MRRLYRAGGKRVLDLLLVITGLAIGWPLLGMLALLVRWRLGTPVLFRQQRPGLRGQPFTLFKFRSMTGERDSRGNLLPDADRLTPFGRFLRSTSLDELPELINVLKGEMSLIGPRPLLMQYLDLYTPEQMRRHEIKPGITGWAQVNGRNALSWEDKFAFDTWYVENYSFWLDMKIMFLTIAGILKREAVNQPGQATVRYFQGSNDYQKELHD